MQTPWGKSDSTTKILSGAGFPVRGFLWVNTPGHGGFALTKRYAEGVLSKAALAVGELKGGYYFFEEDVDYAVVALEVFNLVDSNHAETTVPELGTFKRSSLIKTLSMYRLEYLMDRGIEPDADGVQIYNREKQRDRMRKDRSPDLIVAAEGDWSARVPKGKVGVTCADGRFWLVDAAQYDNRSQLSLLSQFSNPVEVAQ
jgi:hypothetical protein